MATLQGTGNGTESAGKRVLLVSSSASERLAAAVDWLRGWPPLLGVLVVAPARGAADDLVRASVHSGAGRFGATRLTPRQLAADLALHALARDGAAPLSQLGAVALSARAVAAVREQSQLEFLEDVAGYPGFARALAATLRELRLAGAAIETLADAGQIGPDLRRLLAAQSQAMAQLRLADDADLWRAAAAAPANHPLVGRPLLLLDVSPESSLERDAWATLAAASPGVMATAVEGDAEGIARLQVALHTTARAVGGPNAGEARGRLQRLRRWVFREEPREDAAEEPGPDTGSAGADDTVEFLSEPGEDRECVAIVRRLHELAAEGRPFDRMAVLVRAPETYMPLLEEALRRGDIPAYFSHGTVRPDPSGRALLALLACAAEGFTATRFAEYLSLGEVPLSPEPPARVEVPWAEPAGAQLVFKTELEIEPMPWDDASAPSDLAPSDSAELPISLDASVIAGTLRTPRLWEQLIVDAAVVGGRDRWQRRLAGLRREIELRIDGLDDADESGRRHLQEQGQLLRNLERFALPVIERLAALPRRSSWREWLLALRELAVVTLRRPLRVLTVLAELEPMADVGEVDLAEVRRTLEDRLALLRVEPPDRRYGRVLVATIEEARGRSFDTVFLPGLAEGIFPRRAAEDPLLLDEYRRVVDHGLATQDQRYARERLLLRIAAGAAERRLVVSYPTLDTMQGRARVPSFYALDVLRAAEGRLPDLEALRRHAAGASRSRLGWPAPRDAACAIDTAEFDIATLEPYLAERQSDGRGVARYLLDNEHLARSLRARWMRWQSRFAPADGLVDPGDEGLAALAAHQPEERSYSPTALQHFASCPYRFLLSAVHRLRAREERTPLERLDPLTRGSIFHEAQYALQVQLRDRGLLPVTAANREEVSRLADATLDAIAARAADELAPAIPRVWRDEIEGLRTDLRGWVRSVAETDSDWLPSYFEFAFGLGNEVGRDPLGQRREAAIDGFRLRGSIDLVEQHRDGSRWRVTDHKTGKAPRERYLAVGGGEVLQPLLYALAAEDLLELGVDTGRLFYCTRRGGFETREVPANAENRAKVQQVLATVRESLQSGFLPAAPRDRACDYCDYRAVCGPYEETRVRGKDRSRLAALDRVRGMP